MQSGLQASSGIPVSASHCARDSSPAKDMLAAFQTVRIPEQVLAAVLLRVRKLVQCMVPEPGSLDIYSTHQTGQVRSSRTRWYGSLLRMLGLQHTSSSKGTVKQGSSTPTGETRMPQQQSHARHTSYTHEPPLYGVIRSWKGPACTT